MGKYRKKPVEIEAHQWFKNGDHPEDGRGSHEGNIVRRYRTPESDQRGPCAKCGASMGLHGWVDTLEGGHIICPGDWIVTGVLGEHYPCKPDAFELTYELVEDPADAN